MTGAKCNLRVLSGKDSFCYETHNDPFCIDGLTVAERLDVPVARSGLASDGECITGLTWGEGS